MEEMTRKQPDVDKVTKTYKRRTADPSALQSHIPVLDKGRAGSKPWPSSLNGEARKLAFFYFGLLFEVLEQLVILHELSILKGLLERIHGLKFHSHSF